jgi:hypothetical protein
LFKLKFSRFDIGAREQQEVCSFEAELPHFPSVLRQPKVPLKCDFHLMYLLINIIHDCVHVGQISAKVGFICFQGLVNSTMI